MFGLSEPWGIHPPGVLQAPTTELTGVHGPIKVPVGAAKVVLSGGAYVGVSGVFIFNVGVGCPYLPFRGDNMWEGIIEGCLYVNLSAVSMCASLPT